MTRGAPSMVRRTALLGGLGVMLPWLCRAATIPAMDADILAAVDRIERSSGGRLGVAVLNISTGRRIGHRAGERFAMCSTFKCLAAACVLARVDRGLDRLDRRIVVSSADLVHYAPVTERRIGGPGMTLGELCEAAVTVSDNTAANLLLAHLGGPAALTSYARALGDDLTRLDRIEPALNDVEPGDARDTTTPDAMLDDLRRIVLGNALSPSSRDRIVTWLVGNRTGDARLRAGLPGTGGSATRPARGSVETTQRTTSPSSGRGSAGHCSLRLIWRTPRHRNNSAIGH